MMLGLYKQPERMANIEELRLVYTAVKMELLRRLGWYTRSLIMENIKNVRLV